MTALTAVLDDRALVRIAGPDTRRFLQGLLSQDVETLGPGDLRYAALLTPQGRLRLDMMLWGEEDGVILDLAGRERDALIEALRLYRLRAKVEIAAQDGRVAVAIGPVEGDGWTPDPRLKALGYRRLTDAPPRDAELWRRHRIALGVADPVEDAEEPLYPIEANLDLLNGIDFRKGCFVGQETTSRMKRRGPVKSRVAPVRFEGDALAPGAEIVTAEGLRAGRVLTGVEGRSLALFRIDRALSGPLTGDGRPVVLDVPEWLAPAFTVESAAASG